MESWRRCGWKQSKWRRKFFLAQYKECRLAAFDWHLFSIDDPLLSVLYFAIAHKLLCTDHLLSPGYGDT